MSRIRLSLEESTARRIYRNYKRRANEKGIAFDIPFDTFTLLLSWNCSYCGVKPDLLANGKRCSLDRISSTEGYVPEDLLASCWKCNRAKSVMTQKEFIAWIKGCAESMHTSIWGSGHPVSQLLTSLEKSNREAPKTST
jgi:hypothetical protein